MVLFVLKVPLNPNQPTRDGLSTDGDLRDNTVA